MQRLFFVDAKAMDRVLASCLYFRHHSRRMPLLFISFMILTMQKQFEKHGIPLALQQKAIEMSQDRKLNPDNLDPVAFANRYLVRTREEMIGTMETYYTD